MYIFNLVDKFKFIYIYICDALVVPHVETFPVLRRFDSDSTVIKG